MSARSEAAAALPAPAHPARLRIFLPSQRPTPRSGEWIETAWGRCRVTGRLGQRHADLHDALLSIAEATHREPDGRLRLLIDPARLRRTLGEHYSHQHLWVLMRELAAAVIEWQAHREGVRGIGHVLDEVIESTVRRRDPLSRNERTLWRVTLGSAWVASMEADLRIQYDVSAVARLTHGVTQAVARLMLTHAPGTRYLIGTALSVVGVQPGMATRDARRRLRAERDALAAAGVALDGDYLVSLSPRRRTGGSVVHPPGSVVHPPGSVVHPPDFSGSL